MSLKVSSKNPVTNKAPRETVRKLEQKKDIKECLKLLQNGDLQVSDVGFIYQEVNARPHLGDHIQYELHKYCKRDLSQINLELVVKLAEICYSTFSVSHFTNVDRFLGCVYYISSYLLKMEKYETALNLINSLELKKAEILQASSDKSDVQITLCNIHSTLIASAISLASKGDNCSDKIHNLAMASLSALHLISAKQIEFGKKALKTSILYLQTIQFENEEKISNFYNKLNTILKILVPKIEPHTFCLHYLHKLNQPKKIDSEMEIKEMLIKMINLMTLCLKSSVKIKNCLVKVMNFFFNECYDKVKCSPSAWITPEDFNVFNVKQWEFEVFFIIILTIFNYGVQFVWKKYEKNWCENISLEFVRNLSNCLLSLHKFHSRNPKFYCSSSGSLDCCFGDLISGNLAKVQYSIRLCLKNKIPNSLSLVLISQEAFKMSMECLDYMESRKCSIEQRNYSWKHSVIHHTNTVEDICRHLPSEEGWNLLKKCSQEIIKIIINSNVELPFNNKRINILFQRWHTSSLKLKNYPDALFSCLVYYIFYPEEEKEIISMWLQTKSESSNEVIQEMTMFEMLKSCDKSLKEFCPNYESSKVSLKNVLLMEINAYSFCPTTIFQNVNTSYILANRIWNQLKKCSLSLWETAFALSALISVNVALDNKKLPNGLLERCQQLIDDLLNFKGKEKGRNTLQAGNLNFSLFLYNVKLAENSEGQLDTSHMVLNYLKKAEEEKVKFGEDVDLNLTCDIIPSSNHLTVALETNYLEKLTKIVEIWSDAIRLGFEIFPSVSEFDLWERNVKQVAHLYTLYGEYKGAFSTWLLFYKIGKLRGNSTTILSGLTHLLENCSDVDASEMKKEAETISENLGLEESEKYANIEYNLTMASNHLKNKKSEKCLEYLNRGRKILDGCRNSVTTSVLNAKFWCLVSQFLILYKEHENVFNYPRNTDARVMAFKAFNYANGAGRSELIKTAAQSECMELILTMLHVNLWAYHLYGVYRQTDFMRFFLDDLYQIVQKLLLPTRTAEMLVKLAEVDILCEKVDDCQGKVAKLKNILTTLSSKCGENSRLDCSPCLGAPEKPDSNIPSSPRAISPVRFLDKAPRSKDLDLSPFHYYMEEKVKPSTNSEHKRKCKCRLCENFLIQCLTLNTIWLEAEILNLRNDTKEADKYYLQGMENLKKLEILREEENKILRVELAATLNEIPGELDFQNVPLKFLTVRFLIRETLFEISNSNGVRKNVLENISRIKDSMKDLSYEVKLLQWTFAELKLVCLILYNKNNKQIKKLATPVQLKTKNITKTPYVSAATVIERNRGRRENCGNVEAEVETEKRLTAMKTLVKGAEKTNSLRTVLQRRVLNFDTIETEEKVETVRKYSKERNASIKSKKLDFDISGDLFEDCESNVHNLGSVSIETSTISGLESKGKKERTKNTVNVYKDSKEETKKGKKTMETESKEESKRKRTTATSVRIYNESKDESKKKSTTSVKVQSKSRKV